MTREEGAIYQGKGLPFDCFFFPVPFKEDRVVAARKVQYTDSVMHKMMKMTMTGIHGMETQHNRCD